MHIQWLGQTCVKLQTKNLDQDVVVLIDAYRPAKGDFPRSLSPQLALFSRGSKNAVTLSQNPFVLDTLGEIETKGVVARVFSDEGGNLMFKINAENLNLAHLGQINKKPENGDLQKLGKVDILILPVGGAPYLLPQDAAELTAALEPRVVIPVGFQCDTDPQVLPVEKFLKEIGLKPETTDKKIIIKEKDLPQEETRLYLLEKNY